jgi:hypothetical protein
MALLQGWLCLAVFPSFGRAIPADRLVRGASLHGPASKKWIKRKP